MNHKRGYPTVFFIGVHPRSLVHPLDSPWKDYEMRKGFTRRPQRDEPATPIKNYITRSGLQRLKDEHRFLLTRERPAVTEVVAWAASNGDRSENADYQYGKRRLRPKSMASRWVKFQGTLQCWRDSASKRPGRRLPNLSWTVQPDPQLARLQAPLAPWSKASRASGLGYSVCHGILVPSTAREGRGRNEPSCQVGVSGGFMSHDPRGRHPVRTCASPATGRRRGRPAQCNRKRTRIHRHRRTQGHGAHARWQTHAGRYLPPQGRVKEISHHFCSHSIQLQLLGLGFGRASRHVRPT